MREKTPKAKTTEEPVLPEQAANVSVDPYETAMFAAELGDSPEIDLHGSEPMNAVRLAEGFIHSELMRHTDAVRIIHGRGEQKLRKAIWNMLDELKKHDLVAAYRDANHPGQQGAVTYVALHRIR